MLRSSLHWSFSWGISSSLDCFTVMPLANTVSTRNLQGWEGDTHTLKHETQWHIQLSHKYTLVTNPSATHLQAAVMWRNFTTPNNNHLCVWRNISSSQSLPLHHSLVAGTLSPDTRPSSVLCLIEWLSVRRPRGASWIRLFVKKKKHYYLLKISHVLKGADSETLRTLLSSEKEERVSLSRTLSNSWLLA